MGMAHRVPTVTLWRPVGPAELELLRASGWRAWPPRLPDQPIFYPVLNEAYAIKIARDWNVPASGAGYVTRFEVDAEFARRYPVQQAGGRSIRELWVPAEELAEFNTHMIGPIVVTHEFHGGRLTDLADRVVDAAGAATTVPEVLAMLSVAGPQTWTGLDRAIRSSTGYYADERRWRKIADAGHWRVNALAVLSAACAADGHLRESAVAAIAISRDPLLLPVLVVRTADWVPAVRDAARQALDAALAVADGSALVMLAGVALAMGHWSRGAYALNAVAKALRAAPDEALTAARASERLKVRRLAHQVWLESGRAPTGEAVEAALHDGDAVTRNLCAAKAAVDAVRDRDTGVLGQLLDARTAGVRIEALTGLVKIGHPEAGEAYLPDRSAMMRATAQWAVRRSGNNPAALYRAALTEAPVGSIRTLVAGLGECGTAYDVAVLSPFLGHDKPRVRAEAVRAVHRLGGTVPQLASMLTDPAPVVVRAVNAALRTRPDPVPTARLWELSATGQPTHVRLVAYNQLTVRDSWSRVHVDLHLIADPELGQRARTDLFTWLDRGAAATYSAPSDQLREHLRHLIEIAEPTLGPDRTRRLRWLLGGRPRGV
jgi:hypothetical protein